MQVSKEQIVMIITIAYSLIFTFNAFAEDGFYIIPVKKNISLWSKSGDDLFYNNGNVGIGDTNPEHKVSVYSETGQSNIVLETGDNQSSANVDLRGPDVSYAIGADQLNNLLSFWDINESYHMMVIKNGNVGIGDTNPEHKVSVYSETDQCNIVLETGDNLSSSNLGLRGPNVSYNIAANQLNKTLTFWDQNEQYTMMVIKDGNVGIGTTSPSEKLEVDGTAKAAQFSTGDIVFNKDNTKPVWRMYEDEKGLYVESLTTYKKYSLALKEIQKEGEDTVTLDGYVEKMDKLQAENQDLKARLAKLESLVEALQNR